MAQISHTLPATSNKENASAALPNKVMSAFEAEADARRKQLDEWRAKRQALKQAPVAPASLAMKPVSSGSVFNVGNIKHDESLSTNLSLLHGGIQEPKKAHSRQNSTVLTARSNTSGSGAKNPEHAVPPVPAAFPQRAAPLSPFIKKASSLIQTVDARTVPNAFEDSSAQGSTSAESSAEGPVPKSSNALKLANIQQKLQDCRRQSHAPTASTGSAASFAKPTQSALLKKTQPKAPALPTFEAMMQTVDKQIKAEQWMQAEETLASIVPDLQFDPAVARSALRSAVPSSAAMMRTLAAMKSAAYWVQRAFVNEQLGKFAFVVELFERANKLQAQPFDSVHFGLQNFMIRLAKNQEEKAMEQQANSSEPVENAPAEQLLAQSPAGKSMMDVLEELVRSAPQTPEAASRTSTAAAALKKLTPVSNAVTGTPRQASGSVSAFRSPFARSEILSRRMSVEPKALTPMQPAAADDVTANADTYVPQYTTVVRRLMKALEDYETVKAGKAPVTAPKSAEPVETEETVPQQEDVAHLPSMSTAMQYDATAEDAVAADIAKLDITEAAGAEVPSVENSATQQVSPSPSASASLIKELQMQSTPVSVEEHSTPAISVTRVMTPSRARTPLGRPERVPVPIAVIAPPTETQPNEASAPIPMDCTSNSSNGMTQEITPAGAEVETASSSAEKDPAPARCGTVLVLSPVRAKRRMAEALGSPCILSPVRRSTRTMSSAKRPRKQPSDDAAKDVDENSMLMPGSTVQADELQHLLQHTNYAYVPNPAISAAALQAQEQEQKQAAAVAAAAAAGGSKAEQHSNMPVSPRAVGRTPQMKKEKRRISAVLPAVAKSRCGFSFEELQQNMERARSMTISTDDAPGFSPLSRASSIESTTSTEDQVAASAASADTGNAHQQWASKKPSSFLHSSPLRGVLRKAKMAQAGVDATPVHQSSAQDENQHHTAADTAVAVVPMGGAILPIIELDEVISNDQSFGDVQFEPRSLAEELNALVEVPMQEAGGALVASPQTVSVEKLSAPAAVAQAVPQSPMRRSQRHSTVPAVSPMLMPPPALPSAARKQAALKATAVSSDAMLMPPPAFPLKKSVQVEKSTAATRKGTPVVKRSSASVLSGVVSPMEVVSSSNDQGDSKQEAVFAVPQLPLRAKQQKAAAEFSVPESTIANHDAAIDAAETKKRNSRSRKSVGFALAGSGDLTEEHAPMQHIASEDAAMSATPAADARRSSLKRRAPTSPSSRQSTPHPSSTRRRSARFSATPITQEDKLVSVADMSVVDEQASSARKKKRSSKGSVRFGAESDSAEIEAETAVMTTPRSSSRLRRMGTPAVHY